MLSTISEAYNVLGNELRRSEANELHVSGELLEFAAEFQGALTLSKGDTKREPFPKKAAPVRVIFAVIDEWNQHLGVMCLHSYLRSCGITAVFAKGTQSGICQQLSQHHINVVCYSCTAPMFYRYYTLHAAVASQVGREFDLVSVFGGPHPTHYPEIVLLPHVNFVVRFDGEIALHILVQQLADGSVRDAPGVVYLHGNIVKMNAPAQLVSDLDPLPFPSRKEYHEAFAGQRHFAVAVGSRGCPFSCAYCHNWLGNATFRDSTQSYYRLASPSRFVHELVECARLGYQLFDLSDDTFGPDPEWLAQFCRLYRSSVRLPFQCNLRADLVRRDTAELLASAGCRSVSFGFETSNSRTLRSDFGRSCDHERLAPACHLFQERGVKVIFTSMFGNPHTSLGDDVDTVRLNAAIKPDYAYSQAFQPYPGTGCVESMRRETVQYYNRETELYLESPMVTDRSAAVALRVLICLLQTVVRHPFLLRFLPVLMRLPLMPLYRVLYRLNLAYFKDRVIRRMPLSWVLRRCVFDMTSTSRVPDHIEQRHESSPS